MSWCGSSTCVCSVTSYLCCSCRRQLVVAAPWCLWQRSAVERLVLSRCEPATLAVAATSATLQSIISSSHHSHCLQHGPKCEAIHRTFLLLSLKHLNQIWYFIRRRTALLRMHICLSVCPSVTLRYCVKTRERRGTRSSPSGSLVSLVF